LLARVLGQDDAADTRTKKPLKPIDTAPLLHERQYALFGTVQTDHPSGGQNDGVSNGREGHSAAYLERPQRDFWWNEDFLDLVVRRLGLSEVSSLLDVGCGLGHWTRALVRVLPKLTAAVGVDADSTWSRRFSVPVSPSAALQGHAEAPPFPDGTFDLVTCQTVLIHVQDPTNVLREMRRVTRPGGTVLVAEPSNGANEAVGNTVSARWSVATAIRRVSFYETCSAGKVTLGLGDNSAGDRLPIFFRDAGFDDMSVYVSDNEIKPVWWDGGRRWHMA
jgi:SAM-dependent methyltransferase